MHDPRFVAVDAWLERLLGPRDEALEGALARSEAAGLPSIHVAPLQGMLLQLLARSMGAERILEVGTLGGYSTIQLARALPAGGRLVTVEADPRHAAVARDNLARAGLADVVEVREGRALDVLPTLDAEGPFDFVFLDADKVLLLDYFLAALRLSRPGTLIVADNVVRAGAVVDEAASDEKVRGVRRLVDHLANEPRVRCTAMQTVGRKGWDGMVVARVVG